MSAIQLSCESRNKQKDQEAMMLIQSMSNGRRKIPRRARSTELWSMEEVDSRYTYDARMLQSMSTARR
jgi:hypothetical protein